MREILYSPEAKADLDELHDWIADRAGVDTAKFYVSRIRTTCEHLDVFPMRGVERNDIRAGLRVMGWQRRATIAYAVEERRVIILRVLHKGRSVELAMAETER